MAPLIILLAAFFILYFVDRLALRGRLGYEFVGRAAMAVMLFATGISHFTDPEPLVAIMPNAIPAKLELVYFTGVVELAAVVGLLLRRTAWLASVLLIIFFLAVLPANIAEA